MGWKVLDFALPFATPTSPAVSSARVASRGRWSRSTEAARVMGRSAGSWLSGSGGAEEGEGEEIDADGDGEAML